MPDTLENVYSSEFSIKMSKGHGEIKTMYGCARLSFLKDTFYVTVGPKTRPAMNMSNVIRNVREMNQERLHEK